MTNLFSRFKALLPQAPLLVGNVVAYADGVATVQLDDGGLLQARGEAAIADRVFFRDGVIEGPAPDLPLVTVEV